GRPNNATRKSFRFMATIPANRHVWPSSDGVPRPDTSCTAPCWKAELVKPDSLYEKITRYEQLQMLRLID
ncbi:MAG TPA: hypothetical protein PKD43_18190, partial [Nitrospira sp.]|nr:hypothetical protein [Nitrospira sp.]HNM20171.1 hypothetical protein [Nitrospira sp.]